MSAPTRTPDSLPPMRHTDRYFCLWALFLPVASFLLVPSVQGTTPGFMLALLLLGLMPLLSPQHVSEYYKTVGYFVALFVMLAVLSQVWLIMRSDPPDTSGLILIKPGIIKTYMRPTLITQSLYLLCGVSLFAFVRVYYNPRWDNYFFTGAVILALYGLYEWVFFLATGTFGDFISNRVFSSEDEVGTEGGIAIALLQTVQLGPVVLQRLKSLTNEPSMYAYAILPFWVYATHMRRWVISSLLLLTLFLSTSTTAMLGIVVYSVCSITDRKTLGIKIGAVLAIGLAFLLYRDIAMDTINFVFLEKMSSSSGMDRSEIFANQFDFFLDADLWIQLFGLGFGYTRSGSLILTMLVNCGLIGAVAAVVFFLYPVFRLGVSRQENSLRHALIVLFVSSLTSVQEFSYLPLWLFLGMAYSRLRASAGQGFKDWHSPHAKPAIDSSAP